MPFLLVADRTDEGVRRAQCGVAAQAIGNLVLITRAVARQFRMAGNQYAGDRRIAEIAALLRAEAPDHRPLWDCRSVGAFEAPNVRVGAMPARAHLLHPNGQAGASVLVLAVPTGPSGAATGWQSWLGGRGG